MSPAQKYSPRRDANAWVAYLFMLCAFVQITPSDSLCSVQDGYSTHHAICGDPGRCEEEDKVADNEELHEVRCCSDTPRDGWKKRGTCNVWAISRMPDGKCRETDFWEATCICEGLGARLCTRDELLNGCTKGSGCGYDSDVIWSMTGVDPIATSSPTTSPPVTSPTNPPISTSSPTIAPTSATGDSEYCCTWDFFHCSVDNWCNQNDSNCHGGCGGAWMERNSEAMSCIALHEECTSNINDCCGQLSCVGDDTYKQCLVNNESSAI